MMCVHKHIYNFHMPTTMSLAYSSFLTKLKATPNGKCWLDSLLFLSCKKYQVFYFTDVLLLCLNRLVLVEGQNQAEFVK